ncbi:1052_t:CDS:2 [Entrophospora sp. SA101]|nr:1052_t:CDS:2 [Entrophospora sp. SA101]CAJ0918575.1 10609_t:CDS:2 [Entrophospora sp. SA101]
MSNPNNETTGGVSVDEHENGPKQCIQYEVALVDLKEDIIKKEQTLASKIRDHDKLDKSAKELDEMISLTHSRSMKDMENTINTANETTKEISDKLVLIKNQIKAKSEILKQHQHLLSSLQKQVDIEKKSEETPRAIPDIHNILNTYTTNLILIAPEGNIIIVV